MNQVIISEAFDYAISNYIKYRQNKESLEYNSFFVVVIRLLCVIYDEKNIIDPYINKDSQQLELNLCKYGYDIDKVIDFKQQFDIAYNLSLIQKSNPYFLNIQKILVDMLMKRKEKENVDERIKQFYDLMYTPENKNPLQLSELFLNAKDEWEIDKYFKQELIKHQKIEVDKPKIILNPEAYAYYGLSMERVNDMSGDYLDLINHQIYLHFGIKENAINKDYLLEKALEKASSQKLTSGNGYVDILLMLSIIGTISMIAVVITVFLINR